MNAERNFTAENDAIAQFLAALVREPSVNPPGNEGAVAALMSAKLDALGFSVQQVEAAPGRPSIVARLAGTGDGPTLLFNGHMDVQPPGTRWTREPFAAEIEDGRLYGQGSMDMKAGLTAMVFAVEALQQAGRAPKGDVIITAVADEVCGGHLGTGYLVEQGLVSADMAIVGEPTGDTVRVAHRGALWLEVEIGGRSAHGGRPWLGVNAISKAARIIAAIEQELLPSLQSRTHPLLPAPTINLGTVTGGTKFNLVADRAVLQIDRRLVPGETPDQAQSEIEDLCRKLQAADDEEWTVSVKRVMHVTPAEIDPEAPIVVACQEAHRAVTGELAEIGATAGFEDAHFLLDAGIPTAMYGPYRRTGKGEDRFFTNSGMADESVALDDVARAVTIYARLIDDLVGTVPVAGGSD